MARTLDLPASVKRCVASSRGGRLGFDHAEPYLKQVNPNLRFPSIASRLYGWLSASWSSPAAHRMRLTRKNERKKERKSIR
jgi:hypothetical protein